MRRWNPLVGGLMVFVVGVSACSSGGSFDADSQVRDETVASTRAAVVQSAKLSFAVPSQVDYRNVAVAAGSTLLLGDRAQLLNASGGFADSSSAGTVNADYGHGAQVGSIVAAGPVRVFEDAKVNGSIKAGQAVTFGAANSSDPALANVTVTGPIVANASVPTRTLSWTVPFDLNTTNNPTVSSGSMALAPGSYGQVNVQGGTLTLQPGVYYIDTLTQEPNTTISINSTAGPVYIYVRTSVVYHGNWTVTKPENVLLGYLGAALLALETPFAGTVVAPNARVRLAVGGTPHTGAVLAKEAELDPDVKLTLKPFSAWNALLPDLDLTADVDCDGAPDALEAISGMNPADPNDGKLDTDGDGVPAKDELLFGGNPLSADTDGDGIRDDIDLIASVDLDGDGKVHSQDNCPNDTNPGQQDADVDGIGDVCDPTPLGGTAETALTTLAVYRGASGDGALAPPGNFDTRRLRTDLKGLYATDATVLAFEAPLTGGRKVTEYWHPAGNHIYAATGSERSLAVSQGFLELATYYVTNTPSLGVPVQLRRFRKQLGGRWTHTIAITAESAAALQAEGYSEISALGYGLTNQGSFARSTLVIRYQDGSNHYHYRFNALSEPDIANWKSNGRKFRVFARPSPSLVPLYRLVNAAGMEALAKSSEVASFQSQGFVSRGVLGYVYPAGASANSVEPTVVLNRVSGPGKETVYTVDASETTSLLAAGYTSATAIARVVALRGLDRFRDGAPCVGARTPAQSLNRGMKNDEPIVAAAKTLAGLASACTLKRVTEGYPLTPTEQNIKARLATMDPIIVQTAAVRANRILSLTPSGRAALLGPLGNLNPGNCASPVDWNLVMNALKQVRPTNTLDGTLGNSGTTGSTDPRSLVKMRAPQCQGVTYKSGDRARPGEAARAVTAVEQGPTTCEQETCETPQFGRIVPKVYGVVSNGRGLPAGGGSDLYAGLHEDVGVPIVGFAAGSSCSTCSTALGQACINNACRSYPVVGNHTLIRLSGSNFWDLKTARVRLTRVSNGDITDIDAAGFQVRPLLSNDELPARCDMEPVGQSSTLGIPDGVPTFQCPPRPATCVDPYDRVKRPNEKFAEGLFAFVDLPDGAANDFYTVQVMNFNGSYVPRNEPVPFNLNELRDKGRSVHVCVPPACTPVPSSTEAACSLPLMPTCGGTVGGTWTTPPRSLSECTALRDASGDPNFKCPETPFVFTSPATADDGTPLQIYIKNEQPEFLQTRLTTVKCNTETGWAAFGSDELVVAFGSLRLDNLAIADQSASLDVYTTSINEHRKRFPDKRFGAVRSDLTDKLLVKTMLQAGEDDDVGAAMVFTSWVASNVAYFATPGGYLAQAAGAVSGGIAAFWEAYTHADNPKLDPDEFIGREGWGTNSNDVSAKGVLSHGAPLESVAIMSGTDDRKDVMFREAGKHPAVDGMIYDNNPDVIACSSNANCSATRPTCLAGACVPADFTDRTAPVPFDPLTCSVGTIEHMRMTGDADYEFWVSTSMTGSP